MTAHLRLAALAGCAAIASLSGAAGAITSVRPPLMLFCAALLLAAALQAKHARTHCLLWLIGGAAAGLTLPRVPPPVAGPIVSHSFGRSGDLFDVLDRIDGDPSSMLGRVVTVSGTWRSAAGSRSAAVFRRVMACCAADAIAVGLDVLPAGIAAASDGDSVAVSGALRAVLREGELRYALTQARVRRIAQRPPGS
jgi:hypothetical protein